MLDRQVSSPADGRETTAKKHAQGPILNEEYAIRSDTTLDHARGAAYLTRPSER
jgi:hypothetical protein